MYLPKSFDFEHEHKEKSPIVEKMSISNYLGLKWTEILQFSAYSGLLVSAEWSLAKYIVVGIDPEITE